MASHMSKKKEIHNIYTMTKSLELFNGYSILIAPIELLRGHSIVIILIALFDRHSIFERTHRKSSITTYLFKNLGVQISSENVRVIFYLILYIIYER